MRQHIALGGRLGWGQVSARHKIFRRNVLKRLFHNTNGIMDALRKQRGSKYAAQNPTFFSSVVVASVASAAMFIDLFIQ